MPKYPDKGTTAAFLDAQQGGVGGRNICNVGSLYTYVYFPLCPPTMHEISMVELFVFIFASRPLWAYLKNGTFIMGVRVPLISHFVAYRLLRRMAQIIKQTEKRRWELNLFQLLRQLFVSQMCDASIFLSLFSIMSVWRVSDPFTSSFVWFLSG